MVSPAVTLGTSPPPQWRLIAYFRPSPTTPRDARYNASGIDDLDRFIGLVRRWRLETAHCSLVKDMVSHSAFKEITSMGPRVVPWIIRDLKSHPDFLVLALPAIVGEDPVPPSARGKIGEIVNAWLTWYERTKWYE